MRAMPSKQSMSYLASFSTSKLQKKPSPTCLLVSQSLAAPVQVCHLRLGAPLLTSALISRAPCGGESQRIRTSSSSSIPAPAQYVYRSVGTATAYRSRSIVRQIPRLYICGHLIRIQLRVASSCLCPPESAYSRPSASNKAALSTEMVGILAGL
jgi:hypothetical protein